MLKALARDARANSHDPAAVGVLAVYRFGRWAADLPPGARHVAGAVYSLVNLVVLRVLLGVDLPRRAQVGPGLKLHHLARGLVVHPDARIGADCTVFHNVTIGQRRRGVQPAPTIGDRVLMWPGCVIAGDVRVGDDAEIGALALVLTDVPAGGRALPGPSVVTAPR